MRINVLQHTPNEGVGAIGDWAKENGHDLYIYHPYFIMVFYRKRRNRFTYHFRRSYESE